LNGLTGHPYDQLRRVELCLTRTTCSVVGAAALVAVADETLTLPAPTRPRTAIAAHVAATRRPMDRMWAAGPSGRRVCV
jgi:hypothetical protein